jgi:hypothetical protein
VIARWSGNGVRSCKPANRSSFYDHTRMWCVCVDNGNVILENGTPWDDSASMELLKSAILSESLVTWMWDL